MKRFKIAAKHAKDIGSLFNAIASSEIMVRDALNATPYDSVKYNLFKDRAIASARTLLVEYGIVAIGYFKHEDLEDYRRGLLAL